MQRSKGVKVTHLKKKNQHWARSVNLCISAKGIPESQGTQRTKIQIHFLLRLMWDLLRRGPWWTINLFRVFLFHHRLGRRSPGVPPLAEGGG